MSKLRKILPFMLGGTLAVVGLTGGIIGLTARNGKDGKQGSAGPRGAQGEMGLSGPKGDKGNAGIAGESYNVSELTLLELAIRSEFTNFKKLQESKFYDKYKKAYDEATRIYNTNPTHETEKAHLIAWYQLANIENVFDDKLSDLALINRRWTEKGYTENLRHYRITELNSLITQP